MSCRWVTCALITALLALGCGGGSELPGPAVVTFPISALGAEGRVLVRQLARFMKENPGIKVVQRVTPDGADQKHQLYVQWLNAGASDPDILQVDVIWTPEFAAAGWILPLDRFAPDTAAFFPVDHRRPTAGRAASIALPWFVDVGMLYWRTDLFEQAPATWDELDREARRALADGWRPATASSGRARATRDW